MVAQEKSIKITARSPLALVFRVDKFWNHRVIGSLSFGFVEFRGRRVSVSSSFGVVKFWVHQVMRSSSFGFVEFQVRRVSVSSSFGFVEF